jgi:hypothetical protein
LGLHFTELAPHLLRGVFFSAMCLAVVAASRWSVGGYDVALVNIVVSVAAMSVVLLLLVWMFPNLLGEHAIAMLIRFVPKLGQLFIGGKSCNWGRDV